MLGLILVGLPLPVLRRRGAPEPGEGVRHTTVLVRSGIYSVVRHPVYLGWGLMYVAAALFSQHRLVVLLAVLGLACLCGIVEQEDEHLQQRFGEAYVEYRRAVPAVNLLAGVLRLTRRKP